MASKTASATVTSCLQCSLCSGQVIDPCILPCLHSFCKTCVDKISYLTLLDSKGCFCPMCGTFASHSMIRKDEFLGKLITLKNKGQSPSQEDASCNVCPNKEKAFWKCVDCKHLKLCENCRKGHSKIPLLADHNIITIHEIEETVIDEVIYCPKHQNNLCYLNCKICETLICQKCNIEEHDTHQTESVQQALDRLIPVVQRERTVIKRNIDTVSTDACILDYKISEINSDINSCRREIAARFGTLGKEVEHIKIKKENDLDDNQAKSLQTVQYTIQQLISKCSIFERFLNRLTVLFETNRHASLLQRLNEGVLKQVYEHGHMIQPLLHYKLNIPHFKYSREATDVTAHNYSELFGEVNYSEKTYKLYKCNSGIYRRQYNACTCHNIEEVFLKYDLLRIRTIDLSKEQKNEQEVLLSCVDGDIWIVNDIDKILVYSIAGSFEKEIKLHYGRVFEILQLSNDEVILASAKGLFISYDKGIKWCKMSEGKYPAISFREREIIAYNSTLYIIESWCLRENKKWEKASYVVMDRENEINNPKLVFACGKEVLLHFENTIVIFEKDNDKWENVKQWTNFDGLLFAIDQRSNLLMRRGQELCAFKLQKTSTKRNAYMYQISDMLKLKPLMGTKYPLNIVVDKDNNVWATEKGPNGYFIRKYIMIE